MLGFGQAVIAHIFISVSARRLERLCRAQRARYCFACAIPHCTTRTARFFGFHYPRTLLTLSPAVARSCMAPNSDHKMASARAVGDRASTDNVEAAGHREVPAKRLRAASKTAEEVEEQPAVPPGKRTRKTAQAAPAELVAKEEEAALPAAASTTKRATRGAAKPPKPAAAAANAVEEEEAVVPPPVKRTRVAKAVSKAAEPEPPPPTFDLFVVGQGPFGQLGLGEDDMAKNRPAQVMAGTQFLGAAAGGMHTAALDGAGQLWSWGVNDEGSLGRHTAGTCWDDVDAEAEGVGPMEDHAVPGRVAVPQGIKFTQVVAGDGFTMALAADGSVWGCGTFKDDVGAGTGFTASVATAKLLVQVYPDPQDKPRRAPSPAVQLAAGARHCVLLTQDGKVLTWGIGSNGQLGRLSPYNTEHPPAADELFAPAVVPLTRRLLGGSTVEAIATGSYSTFVITKAGHVIAWGLNNCGQLGFPKPSEDDADNRSWHPARVASVEQVASVKGGEHHTLFVMRDGTLRSCGAATYGMLGRSDVNPHELPREIAPRKFVPATSYPLPQPVGGEVAEADGPFVSAAATMNLSAAITGNGQLWLWGSNLNNQLAKGNEEADDHLPVKFRRTKVFGFRQVTAFCFGGLHAVMLAGPKPPDAPPAQAAPVQ